MTQEEAIRKIREWDFLNEEEKEVLETICPELKESEDERIRKAIIEYIKIGTYHKDWIAWLEKQGKKSIPKNIDDAALQYVDTCAVDGEITHGNVTEPYWNNHSMMNAYKTGWLEKQGEQNYVPIDKVVNFLNENLINDKDEVTGEPFINFKNYGAFKESFISYFKCKILEKQGEQNPADEIKPKFKVGDWVIDKQGIAHQIANVIENVTNHTYGYDVVGGGYFNDNTEGVRLWSIQDAKDGDVLVDVYGNIGIIQEYDDFDWRSYYSLGINGGFQNFKVEHENDKTHPATKEQRDLLFSKMEEAGYEWNAEKKELKKIHVIDEGKGEMDYCFTKMMAGEKVSSAWSEEDEYTLNETIQHLEELIRIDKAKHCACDVQYYQRDIDWLKSLKQRIGG